MMDKRRLLDVVVSAAGLAATAPLIAALAAAVRLDSPGPAFYVQTRLGRDRRPIRLIKLRSMRRDAERHGPSITAGGDARVTRLGRLLRATKLDELPQLVNVLRGDMSLVGPRPEVERYVRDDQPAWQRVLAVRPGITDRASLAFRNEEALLAPARDRERAYVEALLPVKLRLAVEGIEQASLGEDVRTLARTVLAVLGLLPPDPALDEVRRRIVALERGEAISEEESA